MINQNVVLKENVADLSFVRKFETVFRESNLYMISNFDILTTSLNFSDAAFSFNDNQKTSRHIHN
jgi:hypothetical protein